MVPQQIAAARSAISVSRDASHPIITSATIRARTPLREQIWNIVEISVPDANSAHCHLRNFFQGIDADDP
jgi:hypothetical protein